MGGRGTLSNVEEFALELMFGALSLVNHSPLAHLRQEQIERKSGSR
jgi:hypothetical protein